MKLQPLFAVYDTATNRYFKTGGWYREGQIPRKWRERGHLKLAMIHWCDLDRNIPRGYEVAKQIVQELPNSHWSNHTALANKRRVDMLPDTYEIHQLTENGIIRVGTLKEWY